MWQHLATCGAYRVYSDTLVFKPLITTLKLQSNGPSYSNTVIGTLVVDGWDVAFGTTRRGLGGAAARPGLSLLYQMSQPTQHWSVYQLCIIQCSLWSLKG